MRAWTSGILLSFAAAVGFAQEKGGEYESGPYIWGGHQISVDNDGNLYVAEAFNGRLQKFKPRAGADPATLVGQPLRWSPTPSSGSH